MDSRLKQFLAQGLKDFKTHLESQGVKAATIEHRLRGAEQFIRFLLGWPALKGERTKGSISD